MTNAKLNKCEEKFLADLWDRQAAQLCEGGLTFEIVRDLKGNEYHLHQQWNDDPRIDIPDEVGFCIFCTGPIAWGDKHEAMLEEARKR